MTTLAAAAGLIAMTAVPAIAQEQATTLDQLRRAGEAGRHAPATDAGGVEVRGRTGRPVVVGTRASRRRRRAPSERGRHPDDPPAARRFARRRGAKGIRRQRRPRRARRCCARARDRRGLRGVHRRTSTVASEPASARGSTPWSRARPDDLQLAWRGAGEACRRQTGELVNSR